MSVDTGAPTRSTTVARVLWAAVVGLCVVSLVASEWYLRTRGSCSDGAVRLIDLGGLARDGSLIGLLLGGLGLLLALRPQRHRVLAVVGAVLLVPVVFVAYLGVGLKLEDVGVAHDPVCWSF